MENTTTTTSTESVQTAAAPTTTSSSNKGLHQRTALNAALNEAVGPSHNEPDHVASQMNAQIDEQRAAIEANNNAQAGPRNLSRIEGLVEAIRQFVIRLVNAVRRLFAMPPMGDNEMRPNQESPQFSFGGSKPHSGNDQNVKQQTESKGDDEQDSEQDKNEEDTESEQDQGQSPGGVFQFDGASTGFKTNLGQSDGEDEVLAEEYSLFDKDAPVRCILSPQDGGALGLQSSFVGNLNEDAKVVMQKALSKFDQTFRSMLDREELTKAQDVDVREIVTELDVMAMETAMKQAEQALAKDMLSYLEQDVIADEGTLKTAVEAIVTGLPAVADEAIDTTLSNPKARVVVRDYLKKNRNLVEDYLVDRSIASSMRQIAANRPKQNQSQADVERGEAIQARAQVGLQQQDNIKLEPIVQGRIDAERLMELEEQSALDFDENGLISSGARPRA